ncbi:ATP-dependent Clp protease adaptor protein ClpS [Olavius algarvensis associated proteobacterium Delta 3]|nr:ATP-dependent Clp protease adaptor protein ClpS [Olavius algarvensis associated proteobacterium Delta 3]CAB5124817.1 ATP-dependent Clp protease adaptor protein ClpS [Olavius algarvensis associated proteobacterium Delta 3]
MSPRTPELDDEVASKTEDEVAEPPLYRVLLHNDDYTTMEFVVEVLIFVFNKSAEQAAQIMLNVHHYGIGVCGTFPYAIAESKVDTVLRLAQDKGFPLKCTMEKE